jgi:ribosomal protein S18 acetylase RimI-like enzyme
MHINNCEVTDELIYNIREGLKQYSLDVAGFISSTESFGFKASIDNKFVGGAVVETFLGEVYIKYLYVDPNFRHKGIGTSLMNYVFDFAKDRNAKFITVTTLSFQAPDFYTKFDFDIELVRKGYTNDVVKYYLKKNL